MAYHSHLMLFASNAFLLIYFPLTLIRMIKGRLRLVVSFTHILLPLLLESASRLLTTILHPKAHNNIEY